MKTLSGWKEIAVYMNQGVRTVQRWERLGLPVHRLATGKRSQVVAFAEELNAWERTAPRRLLDEILDLKTKVLSLEEEVISLKGELKDEKKISARAKMRSGPRRRSVALSRTKGGTRALLGSR